MKEKILFCVTTLAIGGTERVLLNYIKLLSGLEKYDLKLCVLFRIDNIETMHNEFKPYVNITYLSSSEQGEQFLNLLNKYTLSFKDKIKYALFRKRTEPFLKKKFHDIYGRDNFTAVVQADTSMPSFIRNFNKTQRKIIFIHFALEKLYGNFFKNYRLKRWMENLKYYTGIVATSQEMIDKLKYLNDTNRKVLLIYNPHLESDIKQKSNEFLSLPEGYYENKYIVSIARLDENQKDFTTLIKAMQILIFEKHFNYKLLIVGDGRDREYLENLTKELGLDNYIVFVGMQKNTYSYTKQSRLFVLSSKFEGLPSVLIETLLLDKLIISTDCPTGPREILANENLLSILQDPNDLSDKIYSLLNNKVLEQQMYTHLQKQKVKFSSEKALSEFLKLIE